MSRVPVPLPVPEAGSRVLVVDDEESNRILLRDLLETDGAHVTEAASGEEALARAAAEPPDVILLDIFMPGIDGVEVLRRLKASPHTAPIPVLLLTAARGREERLAGIAAGAADFLSKPVDTAELRLRVRSAARGKRLYDEVLAKYREVAQLERMRDQLVQMLVHDLRSPLTAVRGVLELLLAESGDTLDDDLMRCVSGARDSTMTVIGMISTMLDVSRLEAGEMPLAMARTDLAEVAAAAIATLGTAAGRVVMRATDAADAKGYWDADVVGRVVANLVSNAIKHSPPAETVWVEVGRSDGAVRLSVADRGPGIQEDQRERIFEKFAQVDGGAHAAGASSGLGLAFCKLAAEAHGGSVDVEAREGGGSCFTLELPVDARPAETRDEAGPPSTAALSAGPGDSASPPGDGGAYSW